MNEARASRPWYREPYVWMVIAIPLSAVVGGITMVFIATRDFDGVVVDDYYRRGLEINRTLERDESAARRGLVARIVLDPSASTLRASLEATDASFRPPPSVLLRLLHATRGGLDQEILLARAETGDYAGAFQALEPGTWYLQLEADDWRLTGSVHAPGDTNAQLSSRDLAR